MNAYREAGGGDAVARRNVEAKLSLAESFAELAEAMPLDRITVNMVVDQLGKHRKTFYYHFSDKSQLVVWLFRYELACKLEKTFAPGQLVYEASDDRYAAFPYYVRNVDEDGRIYNALFFDAAYSCLERRRAYYRNVLSSLGPGTLEHYLLELYRPALTEDIRYLIDQELSKCSAISREGLRMRVDRGCSVAFLADFFTGAFISRYIQRLNYAPIGRTAEQVSPFENVIHDSLSWIIRQEVARVSSALDDAKLPAGVTDAVCAARAANSRCATDVADSLGAARTADPSSAADLPDSPDAEDPSEAAGR